MYEGGGRMRSGAPRESPPRLRQGRIRSGGRTRAPALAAGLPRRPVPAGGENPVLPRPSVPAVLSPAIAAALALAATPAWAMPADVAVENDSFGPNAVSINQ